MRESITQIRRVIVSRRSRSATATTEKKPRKEDKNHPNKPIGLPGTPKQKGAGKPAPIHRIKSFNSQDVILVFPKEIPVGDG